MEQHQVDILQSLHFIESLPDEFLGASVRHCSWGNFGCKEDLISRDTRLYDTLSTGRFVLVVCSAVDMSVASLDGFLDDGASLCRGRLVDLGWSVN